MKVEVDGILQFYFNFILLPKKSLYEYNHFKVILAFCHQVFKIFTFNQLN